MRRSLTRLIVEELDANIDGFVSLSHLCCGLMADRSAVRKVMARLVRLGCVSVARRYDRPPDGGGRPTQEIIYRPKSGLERLLETKLKNGCERDRMWKAIRALAKRGSFRRADIAQIAGTNLENVREYTKVLQRDGYLCQHGKGVWVLIRDPGPVRPVVADRRTIRRARGK